MTADDVTSPDFCAQCLDFMSPGLCTCGAHRNLVYVIDRAGTYQPYHIVDACNMLLRGDVEMVPPQ